MKRIDVKTIISHVATEKGIPEEDIKNIYEFFFKRIRYYMSLPNMPKVDILGFFYFKFNVKKINKRMKELSYGEQIQNYSIEYVTAIKNYFQTAINFNHVNRKRKQAPSFRRSNTRQKSNP